LCHDFLSAFLKQPSHEENQYEVSG
jgi:hypothetical protein